MFEIDLYFKAVLNAFHEKRDNNELVELQRASRRDLMKEFLRLLENGELDSELTDLKGIFNCAGDKDQLKKVVKDAGADKFRPLQDFIRQKTSSPADSVIKLLAIFIDFGPRPFEKWMAKRRSENERLQEEAKHDHKINGTQPGENVTNTNHGEHGASYKSKSYGGDPFGKENERDDDVARVTNHADEKANSRPSDVNGTETVIGGDLKDEQDLQAEGRIKTAAKRNVTEDNGKKERPVNGGSSAAEKIPEATVPERPVEVGLRHYYKKNKHVTRFSAAASIIAAIFFTLYFLTPEECMCWNEEQYAVVDCQDKMQRHHVIGLDKNKLAFFRKIKQPDTLGLKDVGHVWYSKIDNEVEFFTQPGLHPIKVDRSLKIATEHIITKYAGRKKNGTKQISETLADVEVQ